MSERKRSFNLMRRMQRSINSRNRRRLTNMSPTLICSNCAGGMLYNWLGLQFRSPFINLYMDNADFILAMEHLDEFLSHDIEEDHNAGRPYPVGKGYMGIRIHFMHYPDFDTALAKWKERAARIDKNNMGVIMTDLKPGPDEASLIARFDRLPIRNKVVLVTESMPQYGSAVCLPGYKRGRAKGKHVWQTRNPFTGKRYIDGFDYVGFINGLIST